MTLDEIEALSTAGRKIFPVKYKTNNGPIKDWPEYAMNSSTEEGLLDLLNRCNRANGELNLGMKTGKDSGVLTLDLDFNKHPEAEAFYEQWKESLDQGVAVLTGGGMHFHFAHPGCDIESKISGIDAGVDLLCDGGHRYVMVPPSIHKSGRPYEYVNPDFGMTLDTSELPMLPIDLEALIFDRSKWKGKAKDDIEDKEVEDKPNWYKNNPHTYFNTDPFDDETISEGGRNNTMTSIAGKLLTMNRNSDYEVEQLIEDMNNINITRCDPPLDEAEIELLCNSVYKTKAKKDSKKVQQEESFESNQVQEDTEVNLDLGPTNETEELMRKGTGAAFGAGILPEPEDKPSPREDPSGSALWILHQPPFKPVGASGTHNLIFLESNFYQRVSDVWLPMTEQNVTSNIQSFYEKANRTQISNMISFMKNYLYFPVKNLPFWKGGLAPAGYPNDPRKLIPFNNGLFDVEDYIKTGNMQGALKPHTDYLFNTVKMPYNLDENAQCPQWLAFLDSIWGSHTGDRAEALREWVGHMMIPDVTQQKIAVLHGTSRSGKSTIGKVLHKLIGHENSVATNLHTLTNEHGTSSLVGKTMAIMYDAHLPPKANGEKALEVVKSISGGDPQVINRKYHDPYTILLTTRIMMVCNEIPRLNDSGNALINRILPFKFEKSFYGQEDPELELKLSKELEGIAVWALEGIKRYVTRGALMMPKESTEELQDLKRILNPISAFTDDCLTYPTANSADEVSIPELYQAYIKWAEENYIHYKLSKDRLLSSVKGICPNISQQKRNGVAYWKGIKLVDEAKTTNLF